MSIKDDKAASILIHLVGQYLAREAGRETLITATRAEIAKDRKNATVFVSVFPDTEGAHALKFLDRHADLFREFLKKQARFSSLPRVRFVLDVGEQNRQHIDELSRDL